MNIKYNNINIGINFSLKLCSSFRVNNVEILCCQTTHFAFDDIIEFIKEDLINGIVDFLSISTYADLIHHCKISPSRLPSCMICSLQWWQSLSDEAINLVREFVKNEGLVRHMLCVEAAMRFYAEKYGEDVELWGLLGLIHDFDWEIHPTLEGHPVLGARTGRALIRR